MPDLPIPNPFAGLAGVATKVAADAWTAAMLTVWSSGLWVLRWVLNLADTWLTPDLSANGPGSEVYRYTFWIAGSLVLLMLMVQLGTAAIRREGKTLATALLGAGQFWLVWCAWLGWGVAVMAACAGLTHALMESMLKIDSWAGFDPFGQLDPSDVSDAVVATVLGGLGCFLWLAAIGHILVLLTRAAALLVLAAATPITAAGLVSEVGRAWFWKSLRWFHAAALTPIVMILVLGLGIQLATGVAAGRADSIETTVGTAIPSVVLICISCFAPLALFRLLAFVDPGTTSGAALRQGLATHGGIQGVLTGKSSSSGPSGSAEGSSAASTADSNGTSQGESSGQDAGGGRFTKALAGAFGPVGAAGVGAMQTFGTKGAAIGADLAGQMGVGHGSYYPDFSQQRPKRHQDNPDRHESREGAEDEDAPGSTPDGPDGTTPGGRDEQDPAQTSNPAGSPTSPAAAMPPVGLPANGSNHAGENHGGEPGADGQHGTGKAGPNSGRPGPSGGAGGAAGGTEGAAAAAV